jgi:hypothetical protein
LPSSMLIRLSGAAAIFAGVLLVVADLLSLTHLFFPLGFESFSEPTIATSVSHYYALQAKTNLLAAVLLLGGLVGLYARQAQAAGLLGLVGFLVAFLGTALLIGFLWSTAFIVPNLAVEAPTLLGGGPPAAFYPSLVTFALGWGIFGIVTLRAGIYPRMAAVLLVISAIGNLLPVPFLGFVFAVAVMCIGFSLFTELASPAEHTQRVR